MCSTGRRAYRNHPVSEEPRGFRTFASRHRYYLNDEVAKTSAFHGIGTQNYHRAVTCASCRTEHLYLRSEGFISPGMCYDSVEKIDIGDVCEDMEGTGPSGTAMVV